MLYRLTACLRVYPLNSNMLFDKKIMKTGI
nr:MAG TPA: hypothetical protein [Caudoviricetes sp.]